MTSRRRPEASGLDVPVTRSDPAADTSHSPRDHRSNTSERNESERQALYLEFAPLFRRLHRRYSSTEALRHEMTFMLYSRFQILLDRYDPAAGIPLRPYLARELAAAAQDLARRHWRLQTHAGDWANYKEESRVESSVDASHQPGAEAHLPT